MAKQQYLNLVWLGIVSVSVVVLLGTCTKDAGDAETDLTQIIEKAWRYRSTPRPLDSTSHPDDPHLPDMRPEAIAHREAFWSETVAKLEALDTIELSKEENINYLMFRFIAEDELAHYTSEAWRLPFDAEGGFHTAFGFTPQTHPFGTAKDYRDYLVKLRDFPTYVDQHIDILEGAITAGYTMPSVIMEDFDQTASAYASPSAEESIFYAPFERFPAAIPIDTQNTLKQSAIRAINESVNPGYRKLAEFLANRYIPASRETIGAMALPGGNAYYQQRVGYYTTLGMTAAEVFAKGQEEVRRIRAEMQSILDEVGFTGTFDEFLQFLRTDPQFYASTPHELLAEASYFSKKVDGKLPAYFGKLPRLPYGVAPVPDEIAPRYTGGRYVPGSYEDHRAGTYWVNTYKLDSRPLYTLPALTLHEAVPGHHLQISLAAEATDRPEFRTDYYISAYGEGWALYTEWLGHEMGMYETPYQKFGALTYEMWRACRLVVDPGMHAFGWSRDSAIAYMEQNTALSMHEIHNEIDRYIGWPGQAVSYKIGELEIRRLRALAEEHMGSDFDLRAFHDEVLSYGSVPLFVLRNEILAWIGPGKDVGESTRN